MEVLKWNPSFNRGHDYPVMTLWVTLPSLLVHFFDKGALFFIAKIIGTPLKLDEATKMVCIPSQTRNLIEVNISKPLPPLIWIGCG